MRTNLLCRVYKREQILVSIVLFLKHPKERSMKAFNRIGIFAFAIILFTACSPAITPAPALATETNLPATAAAPVAPPARLNNPYAPQAADSSMMRGDLTIESSSLTVTKGTPPQVTLDFAYRQPTPCFQLRMEVSLPDAQGRININAYAVADKDKACTLMALATPLQASLDLGAFPHGHYSVWLNGVKVDEFDS
jgi:hypothetical protein